MRVLVDTARTFRFRERHLISKFVLPAAAPYVIAGMRISLAIALIVGVAAEMIVGQDGVGYFVMYAQMRFSSTMMFASVFTIAVVGYLLNFAFVRIDARDMKWHKRLTSKELQ